MGARIACGVAIGLACACGRIGFDEVGDDLFGDPVPVVLDMPGLTDPVATADLRGLYLNGNADLFFTSRPDATSPWGPVAAIAGLADAGVIETVPALSADGMTMWLGHGIPPELTDIRVTVGSGATWGPPQPVPELVGPGSDSPGSLFDGDRQLAFTSNRNGRAELYVTRRADVASPWEAPAPIAELNDGAVQAGPHVVASGLRVYFAADRDGAGNVDLYVAERAAVTAPFGPPRRLDELASPAEEDNPWLSPDERTILFTSNRTGETLVYTASR